MDACEMMLYTQTVGISCARRSATSALTVVTPFLFENSSSVGHFPAT